MSPRPAPATASQHSRPSTGKADPTPSSNGDRHTAFVGTTRLAAGALAEVAGALHDHLVQDDKAAVLVFCDATGRVTDVDLRGTRQEAVARAAAESQAAASDAVERGPGRPKLGVVSREVTLLPRHWSWLRAQQRSTSATLRLLIEEKMRSGSGTDAQRRARDVTHRFMWALAGDLPDFEEATRAFFAGDWHAFDERIAGWPADVQAYVAQLLAPART